MSSIGVVRSKIAGAALHPRAIVRELNRYVIGQDEAKKVMAVALRNRYRRRMIKNAALCREIVPKNVLMIGSTGVGKTEIVKRLAAIHKAPFIKVEATKFTEIGYVGRDVESVVRDLMEVAIRQAKNSKSRTSKRTVQEAEHVIIDAIINEDDSVTESDRESLLLKLRNGDLNDRVINVDLIHNNGGDLGQFSFDVPGGTATIGMVPVGDLISKLAGVEKRKSSRITVTEAMQSVIDEVEERKFDNPKFIESAIKNVEEDGIIFIDEIDKLISSANSSSRGEISREGVQRDLLPIIEGTAVVTKYGTVNTNNILFIASGSFYASKVSELLPELQGRLPIKVRLKSLTEDDFFKILTVSDYNLIQQYQALLAVDGADVNFTEDGIRQMVCVAAKLNARFEDIGARRLHSVLEKVIEDISFDVGLDVRKFNIDADYVQKQLQPMFDSDQNRVENYIL